MTTHSSPTGDVHDFDFLIGTWTVTSRRLTTRWAGSDAWHESAATSRCEARLDGLVNVDEIAFPAQGFVGMTLRVFDLEQRQWSIYWINSTAGVLGAPVRGGFTGDRGEFYSEDVDDGRPIMARFIWTRHGPDKARWEQAFALDKGAWETNWIMEFTRAAD